MANGYFERGEVYWVRVDTGFGSETGVGRPALIISNDRSNNAADCVNMAWLTTQYQDKAWDIETYATGKRSWVKCNSIFTADKSRLGKSLGMLPPEDMRKVDDALEDQFDLGYGDDVALKEKETEIAALEAEKKDLKSEVARLKAQLEQRDDSKVIELAMYQRLYEKTLNTLVDMKFISDVELRGSKKPEPKKPVEEPKPEEPKIEAPVENAGLVDVNSATFTELKKCGISPNMVLTIIDRRPYKSLDDVKKLPGITNVMWQILVKKICCKAVVTEEPAAPEEPKKQEPDPGFEKVNINTASAKEISDATGLSLTVCYSITGCRKRNGNYRAVEDLVNIPKFTENHLAKYGPMFEV